MGDFSIDSNNIAHRERRIREQIGYIEKILERLGYYFVISKKLDKSPKYIIVTALDLEFGEDVFEVTVDVNNFDLKNFSETVLRLVIKNETDIARKAGQNEIKNFLRSIFGGNSV